MVRTCGEPELEELGFEVGCQTFDEYYVCKCTESGCNQYPEFTDPPSSTTTTAITTETTQREPFYCYTCDDCGSSYGTLIDCSLSYSTRACYYTRLEDGTRYRHCGTPELEEIGINVGCVSANNIALCKCTESGCNKYADAVDTTTTATTTSIRPTTTAADVPQEGQWYCHNCYDCGSSVGTLVDCSLYYTSRYCYYWQTSDGTRIRSCGTPELDEFDIGVGCTIGSSVAICKFADSQCNGYPDLVDKPDVVTIRATTTTTRTTTLQALTTPPAIRQPNQWFCYECTDCGNSAGILRECSQVSRSRSCLLTNSSSGIVSRGCGQELFDERPDGCNTDQGTTLCKCSENGCNVYPEYIQGSTTASPWYCHVCVDCGSSVGAVVPCSGASSCSLIVEDKIVTRSCGSDTMDLLIPEDEGCKTAGDGTILCKCSTRNCNAFQDIVDVGNSHGPASGSRSTVMNGASGAINCLLSVIAAILVVPFT